MDNWRLAALGILWLTGCTSPPLGLQAINDNPVVTWSRISNQAIRETPRLQGAQVSARANALVHISMHDALVSARKGNADAGKENSAIGFAAARTLSALYPERAEAWENAAASSGSSGKALGEAIADKVLSKASSQPWFLETASQFRPSPEHVAGINWRGQFQALIRLRENLSPEQRSIAQKWSRTPVTSAWGETALALIEVNRLDTLKSAQVLAWLHATIDDATLAYTDTQNTYNVPRPETYARQNGLAFTPLLSTPKLPSYPSGHATLSKAAATFLAEIFPESSQSLQRLTDEASQSRLYGGIHFPIDSRDGQALGEKVARQAIQKAGIQDSAFNERAIAAAP